MSLFETIKSLFGGGSGESPSLPRQQRQKEPEQNLETRSAPHTGSELRHWWNHELSEEDRRLIRKHFDPFGASGDDVIKGLIRGADSRPASTLSGIAGHLKAAKKYDLGRRVAEKAVEVGKDEDLTDLHFAYQALIEVCYKERDKKEQLQRAINACQGQVEIAPQVASEMRGEFPNGLPAHRGFQQLAIIYEKQERYEDAIDVAREAKRQGWSGGWDNRVSRLEKKWAQQKRKIGETELEKGNKLKALDYFRQALDLDDGAGVKRKIGKLEKELNQ